MVQKIYADGKWIAANSKLEVKNPYNGKLVDTTYNADDKIFEQAVKAAVKIFPKARKLKAYERSDALFQISKAIEKNRDKIGKLICLESGKNITSAEGEATRAVSTFKLAAEYTDTQEGDVQPLDITKGSGDRMGIIRRYPIGPIFGIAPFNFPLNLAAHKVAPALAAGNPIIIKPASATPLSALYLARLFDKTDLPKQMLQVLPCTRLTANKYVEDERFAMVSFTGSPVVGWDMKKRAGKKKVVLELGGNAGVYIHKDADLDYAVDRTVLGAFAYSGQVCISVQRILVHKDIYDKFTKKFVAKVKKLKVGDPAKPSTDISPIINKKHVKRIMDWIEEAKKKGAKLLTGGKVVRGNTIAPTVLGETPPICMIMREEAFAPIVNVHPVKNAAQALKALNDSKYGLQAGVFTNNHDLVWEAFNDLEVGGVVINDVPTFRVDNMPYGGVKDSGFGREGLKYAIEDMTELKVMVLNRNNRNTGDY